MKRSLKPLLTICICVFSIAILSAQDFQGVATYFSKTNVQMSFDRPGMTEEMKTQIQERMKKQLERSFILSFDRSTSTYKEEEQLATPGGGGGGGGMRMVMMGAGANGLLFKDIHDGTYKEETDLMGKQFLIDDSLLTWDWTLVDESKKIGEYTCYKATAVRYVSPEELQRRQDMRNRFRPNDEKDDSTEEEMEREEDAELVNDEVITAWYTLDIPVNNGPLDYQGLPGLILEVNEGRTTILCSKLVLNPEKSIDINEPTKGKVVSQAEYDEIQAEKMEERSKQFENRGGQRGRGDRIIIRGN